jgi:hypothetical protein
MQLPCIASVPSYDERDDKGLSFARRGMVEEGPSTCPSAQRWRGKTATLQTPQNYM